MVSDSTIMEDVWELVESVLDDVTTGSITWKGSFPSDKKLTKSNYPIGIIDNASILNMTDLTLNYGTAEVLLSVPITVYDTNPKQVNEIISDAMAAIRGAQSTLEAGNLFFDSPLIARSDTGMVMHDGIKLHWIMIDFRFRYIY